MTKLAKVFKDRAVNQAEIARRCGVTRATIGSWASGKTRISAMGALIISDILDVEPRELIGEVNSLKNVTKAVA